MWHLNWPLKENGGFWKLKETGNVFWDEETAWAKARELESTWHIRKRAHRWAEERCGVGDKVRNISGCFITFIFDFIKKNGEAWFNFENREAWKDLCFQKVTLAVCQISNCSSSSPRERKYINRTATKTSDTSFSEFQIEMLGIRMGLSWGTVGFRIAATGQRSIM